MQHQQPRESNSTLTTAPTTDTALLVAILILVVILLLVTLFLVYYMKSRFQEVPSLVKRAEDVLSKTAGSFGDVWKEVVVPGLKTAFIKKGRRGR